MHPAYTLLDSKGRETFLSQTGNFSPNERTIFHKLAQIWSPLISYETVFAIVSAESATARNDINTLMQKMKLARCGILCTQIKEGERVPLGLVLCNQDDEVFYRKLIEEELLDIVGDILKPLPSIQSLANKNITLPQALMVDCSFQNLAVLHAEKEVAVSEILALPCDNQILVLSSDTIKRYITIALAKLQASLQNASLLSMLSQSRNQSLIELKKYLDSKDPGFWIELCKDILSSKELFKQQKKFTLDAQFFVIAEFIHNFLEAQKEELYKKRKAEEERRLDMQSIVEDLRNAPGFFKSEEDFSKLLMGYKERYQDNFPVFKEEFEASFLEAPARKALPTIVHLGRAYIHQANVHPYFLMKLEVIGKELFAVYVKYMEQYIKHRDDSNGTVFYSKDNFETSISDKVKNLDPALYELLQRPNLMAEAIILSVRKHKEIRNPEDIKIHLAPFFHTDRLSFREQSVLFGLNLNQVYKFAYLKLSLFRQIFLKITGKYEDFRKKFSEFSESFSEQETSVSSLERSRAKDSESREDRRAKILAETRAANNSGKKPESKKLPKLAKKRSYSAEEQESAWKEFGKSLDKKS